ncbi:MAG: hypothetical protein DRI81_00610 [Chloroflexi bacterium]|nr:MAG: hypothetical protein DRI81_00610 [Chloroflexota bacterium]
MITLRILPDTAAAALPVFNDPETGEPRWTRLADGVIQASFTEYELALWMELAWAMGLTNNRLGMLRMAKLSF